MLVHNVFSDLLTSTTYFLNNDILNDSYIKIQSFQYNIGNSSFQLDSNKTQIDLPAAIITLQALTPVMNHPYVFHRNIANNMNKVPILYNRTKDIELFMQEEMYTVSVSININCESQLQALEIQFRMMNYIPLNKYLMAYKYISYLEIDKNFLNNYLFDVDRDRIENMFFKHNKYTDSFDHCFSIEYQPLIRLNACDITMDSSSASSFQVACSFEFMCHCPVFITGPKVDYSNLVSKNHLQYSKIPVAVIDNGANILIELVDSTTKISRLEISNNFNPSINCAINGTFSNIKIDYDSVTMFNDIKYDGIIHIVKDIQTGDYLNIRCFIEGDRINGILREIQDVSPGIIRAHFSGLISNKEVFNYLDFQINEYSSINEISTATNTIVNPPFYLSSYKILPKQNNILNSISNINRGAVSVNLSNTYITDIVLSDNTVINLPTPVFINSSSTEFTLDFYYDTQNIIIIGKLDPFNGNISLYNNEDFNNIVQYLYMNMSLNLVKGIPGSISRINTNFNLTNEIISNKSPYESLREFSADYNIVLMKDFDYDDLKNQISIRVENVSLENLTYKFIFDGTIIDPGQVVINVELSTVNLLVFSLANRFIYSRYLSQVNAINPLYFCYNHN